MKNYIQLYIYQIHPSFVSIYSPIIVKNLFFEKKELGMDKIKKIGIKLNN